MLSLLGAASAARGTGQHRSHGWDTPANCTCTFSFRLHPGDHRHLLLSGSGISKGNQLWTDTRITLTDIKNISKPFSISSFLCGFTSSGPSWSPWPCHVSVSCWHFSHELWQTLWICAVLFYYDDLSFVLQSCLEASSNIRASLC